MTAREIINVTFGRVRVNYCDPSGDVSYSMVGESTEIRCADYADSFLDLVVFAVSSGDFEIVISCNAPECVA